jgi:hypothetical protein
MISEVASALDDRHRTEAIGDPGLDQLSPPSKMWLGSSRGARTDPGSLCGAPTS